MCVPATADPVRVALLLSFLLHFHCGPGHTWPPNPIEFALATPLVAIKMERPFAYVILHAIAAELLNKWLVELD